MGKASLRSLGWALIVAAAGILGLALRMYARFGFGVLAEIASDSMGVHVDFKIWWRSAAALLDGEDIYRDTMGLRRVC